MARLLLTGIVTLAVLPAGGAAPSKPTKATR